MTSSQSSEQAPKVPDEMRERATAYMREWWSMCERTEREQGTGIAWLADHVLHVAGVPDLLAKIDELRAEVVWLNRRMLEMADDAGSVERTAETFIGEHMPDHRED
jgi:hypothetical protein